MKKSLVLLCAATLVVACTNTNNKKSSEEMKSKVLYTIDTSFIDRSVSPLEDFYQFANGTWIANNPVPETEVRWGSFIELDKANKVKLTQILDEATATEQEKGSDLQFIGDYYKSMKDMDARNAKSPENIEKIKSEIDAISSKEDIAEAVRKMKAKGITAFYRLYVAQDLKEATRYALYLSQGGLGLPNRDYYTDEDKEEIRKAYKELMKKEFSIFGYDNADEMAESAFAIEMDMAKTMMKPEEMRQPEKTYNPKSTEDLKYLRAIVKVEDYLKEFNQSSIDTIILGQPAHFQSFAEFFNKIDFKHLKSYLAWKYVDHYAGYLNSELEETNFDFYNRTLSGQDKMKPMNERAIEQMTRNTINVPLGRQFVKHHFSEEAKTKVNEMVDNLLSFYKERINNLDWMSEDTKVQAQKKLSTFTRKLGFPDKWKDISGLEIAPDDYIANIDACRTFDYNYNMQHLGQPINRDEWGMPAHLVNAYYNPTMNDICFPAGIMQAPFFDINAEDALNYGGMGMVIGHEITHGFDDEGSKYGADGNLFNWWTEEDRALFEERTEKYGKTFSQFCPFDGVCVNPKLTMGENIADLGGVIIAYHAYTMTDEFKRNEIRNGFTPAQRFFLAYAQLWKMNQKDEYLKRQLATDPHSPAKYRILGPLMNCPEFFEAFEVKEGDPMRKSEEEIARIW